MPEEQVPNVDQCPQCGSDQTVKGGSFDVHHAGQPALLRTGRCKECGAEFKEIYTLAVRTLVEPMEDDDVAES